MAHKLDSIAQNWHRTALGCCVNAVATEMCRPSKDCHGGTGTEDSGGASANFVGKAKLDIMGAMSAYLNTWYPTAGYAEGVGVLLRQRSTLSKQA